MKATVSIAAWFAARGALAALSFAAVMINGRRQKDSRNQSELSVVTA